MTVTKIELDPATKAGRVFVPSMPTRWNPDTNSREAVYSLTEAEAFGFTFMLSLDVEEENVAQQSIKMEMTDYCADDFVLAIGGITRILAAVLTAKENFGRVRLLQWDKRLKKYFCTEVNFE